MSTRVRSLACLFFVADFATSVYVVMTRFGADMAFPETGPPLPAESVFCNWLKEGVDVPNSSNRSLASERRVPIHSIVGAADGEQSALGWYCLIACIEARSSCARCLTNVAADKHFSDAASPQWFVVVYLQ